MLKSELKKKLFNRYFFTAVILLFMMFLFGSIGPMFGENSEETVLSAVLAKLSGRWIHNQYSYRLFQLKSFWNANSYVPVLMPILVGLPGLGLFMEEIKTGNKRFVLARTTKRDYYLSKIVSSMFAAVLVALFAVLMYWIVILVFFDGYSTDDREFQLLYLMCGGQLPDDPMDISKYDMSLFNKAYVSALISLLKFLVYAAKCALFTQAVCALTKDSYLTLGITVFGTYLQQRISEALFHASMEREIAGKQGFFGGYYTSPVFLMYADKDSPAFGNKLWLPALMIVGFIVLWSLVFIRLCERQADVAT